MPRFTSDNTALADDIIARYPRPRSAMIPLLHLAQEQDGYLTEEAMRHIAELVEVTPAEVLGAASFYEMFKREPVGDYLVTVCTNISCLLLGGEERYALHQVGELAHVGARHHGDRDVAHWADPSRRTEGHETLMAARRDADALHRDGHGTIAALPSRLPGSRAHVSPPA